MSDLAELEPRLVTDQRPVNTKLPAGLLWSIPFYALLVGHFVTDTYSAIIPAILSKVEQSVALSAGLSAWLLGVGALSSGLSQPIFALLSDRLNTRIFAGLGLILSSSFICTIPLLTSSRAVFIHYVIGMIGVGMFHPVAASVIGQISPQQRSLAVSLFFVCGMIGGVSGSILAPAIINGQVAFLPSLIALIPFGLTIAIAIQILIRGIQHKQSRPIASYGKRGVAEPKQFHTPTATILLLYISSAIRFFVNVSLLYLFTRWATESVQVNTVGLSDDAMSDLASTVNGRLNAMMIVGMGFGGLVAGMTVPQGREKLPLILVPIVFAPAIAIYPFVDNNAIRYLLSFLAGIGFSAMVPVTVALAQRLLPFRTSFASGLMLGGAWAVSALGPPFASWLVTSFGLSQAFVAVAAVLMFSGVVAIFVPNHLIKQSADSRLQN